MKKIVGLLVAILILVLCGIAAADTIVKSGTHGTNLTWSLSDTGILTISGSGEMEDFFSSGTYDWHATTVQPAVNSVVIESGVSSIGQYAFDGFTNLTQVTMANTVTEIGDYAFRYCRGLTNVELSSQLESIGNSAFFYCSSVPTISFPETLRSIGTYAFNSCESLTTADLPEGLVTIGNSAFDSCRKLERVVIPSTTTTIGDMAFDACHALTEVTIPSTVTSLGDYVFSNCDAVTTVVVEEGITSLPNSTFNNCYALESVQLPSTLTSIETYAFHIGYSAKVLPMTSINIPDNVTEIGSYAFKHQTGLTSLSLPVNLQTLGDYAFAYCFSLTEVTIPNGTETIGTKAFIGDSALTRITIPRSVTEIGDSAFDDCGNVTIYCYDGSAAHTYAVDHEVPFVLVEDEESNEPENGLAAPANVHWKEGSTATAAWDAVDGADYYKVNVFVYYDGQEIGNTETGTANNEIDVQQEINRILIDNSEIQEVQVEFSVTSVIIVEDGDMYAGEESDLSETLTYTLARIKLGSPEEVVINDDYIASWKAVENADYYGINISLVGIENPEAGVNSGTSMSAQPDENGMINYDLSDQLLNMYNMIRASEGSQKAPSDPYGSHSMLLKQRT